jgi:hypothetical protein
MGVVIEILRCMCKKPRGPNVQLESGVRGADILY